jgi:hypothetical protein
VTDLEDSFWDAVRKRELSLALLYSYASSAVKTTDRNRFYENHPDLGVTIAEFVAGNYRIVL